MEELEEKWQRALKETEILRFRVGHLYTFRDTILPYIFLAESSVNIGDTVVRKGKVIAHQPSIFLPNNFPIFEGFDLEKDYHINNDTMRTFLMVRGISFPSLRYSNETHTVEIFEGPLSKSIEYYKDSLERKEDILSGLIVGPEDVWQLSILFFVCIMVSRSAPKNIQELLKDFEEKG